MKRSAYTLGFLLAVVVYIAGLAIFVYMSRQDLQEKTLKAIDHELFVVASSIPHLLAHDFHDRATSPDAIGYLEEMRNLLILTKYSRRSKMAYVWTDIKVGDQVYLTSCNATPEELETNNLIRYWNHYDDVNELELRAFESEEPVFGEIHDKWGDFRAVLIPMYSPAGNKYLACAEYDLVHIDTLLWENDVRSLLIAGFFFLISLPMVVVGYRQLNRARLLQVRKVEQISRLNQDLEAFEYSVSNALKQPLRHIQSHAEIVECELEDNNSSIIQTSLESIKERTQYSLDMTDSLLRLSQAAMQPLNRKKLSLSMYFRLSISKQGIQFPEVKYTADIASGLVVEGDDDLLEVFVNELVTNAFKYSKNDRELILRFYKREKSNRSVYCFEDNGRGIEQQRREKVFVPFHSYHTDDSFEGVGLGLSTCSRIINRHGGSIWIEDGEQGGTRVCFTLYETSVTR